MYARVRSLIIICDLQFARAEKVRMTILTGLNTFARAINHLLRFVHYFVASRHATKRKAQINPSLNYQRHRAKMSDKDATSEGEHFRPKEH